MEKRTAGTNNRSPDGLAHPNQNTIIINNQVKFYKKWKKNNEIQLTKNKMSFNLLKITNHPPSPGIKIEREIWVFISAYGPGSERSEKEMDEFWNELSECVGTFGRNESVVVLGDLNPRVGNEVIEGMVRQHGVPKRNESGKRLLDMCAS